MRILHVIANLDLQLGGPSRACIEMARAVAAAGHEVAVYTTDWSVEGRTDLPNDRPLLRDGVAYRYFRHRWHDGWCWSWPLARALWRDAGRFDLVHLHSLYLFHSLVAPRAARAAGVPYLLRPHGTLDPAVWPRRRWAKAPIELAFQNRDIEAAAALHYTSEDERLLARPYARGRPSLVVPLGLATGDYAELPAPGGFRAAHPGVGDRPILLFLGRLDAKKGLDLLVPAFARLVAGGADLQLVLAGPDRGARAGAERRVADLGLQGRVTFTGMLQGEAKRAALADAALFVLPSYRENFGLAVVEAMASGLAVVISDQVAIWREVEADRAGWICRTEVDSLSEALAAALADPQLLAERGRQARASARARFDWATVTPRLCDGYRAVVEGTLSP
ncbi:Glycosyltransferase involved in cell wall bisynthesis [Tistlia consotensis]|uniref:Glycosyltransferase involved in cell wall bisynthesis n=1 Tax=Tistlia consotensis USBA 355 TaxID=560819 RepID=A0A1Y6CHS3_9PROT|nr:glycosyltransferase [Tistlia consotensis]SMF63213.1 Glycosyltransferase involved in cell wall bisynthesis [Tistlia consotensis USBA 355]SNR95754.1 Glycosyltransferase involved in cell wall bisynthesis [Tistlia consotensis]